nr:DJ-1/PfpI family protein [Streptococcus catagoni]
MPDFAITEVDLSAYDVLLLTGSMDPFASVFDQTLIKALSSIDSKKCIIASISSSPLILAKAGLLTHYRFTAGIYSNLFTYFPWLDEENFSPKHFLMDGNLITALGTKEGIEAFTHNVLYRLGFIKDQINLPEEDISFTLSDLEFETFLKELAQKYPITSKENE